MEDKVAPHVGAWIETALGTKLAKNDKSHPMWVRGLKLFTAKTSFYGVLVAPHVGAWIETDHRRLSEKRISRRTPCGCVD